MSIKPLTRLRLGQKYWTFDPYFGESTNPTSRQFHANVREGCISRLKLLQQIFGKELFNQPTEV